MATSTGNTINSKWRANAYYTTSETNTNFSVTVTLRLENRSNYHYTSTTAVGYYTNGTTKYTGSPSEVGGKAEGGVSVVVAAHTYTYTKGTTSSSKKISYSITTKGSMAGGTSSGSFTITVPALDKYTITYYPNGGSGNPVTQTKYYGKSVTINASSTFLRSGYSFLKWNTMSGGTGLDYAAGATYSGNAGLSLYAQWKQNYNSPKVEILKCYRTHSNDSMNPQEDDEGERIFCSVKYTSGYKTAGVYEDTMAYIYVNNQLAGSQSVTAGVDLTTSFNIAEYSVNNSYEVKIKIGDTTGSTYKIQTIPSATYPIDLLTDSSGVCMGIMMPAQEGKPVSFPRDVWSGGEKIATLSDIPKFYTHVHNISVTVSANGQTPYDIPLMEGMTINNVFGVSQANVGNNNLIVKGFARITDGAGSMRFYIRNVASSQQTGTLYTAVTYVK